MKKVILFCITAALILGNFNFINIAADQEESKTIYEECPSYLKRDTRIVKPTIDQNSNRISDKLENSLFVLSDNETMIDVIVALDHAPNVSDISTIELFGGIVYETWNKLIFALHAKIPQKNLAKYALNDEVVLIEENAKIQTCLDYSVKQMRVRPTVWDTYGYSGDINHAIAILDTGIDDSHPDLSGKIVKWKDFTDDNYNNPIDKGEHGTHCAGIAVGTGTKSGTNTKKYTWSSWFDYYYDPPWPTYVAPSKSGTLQMNLKWDDDFSDGMGEGLIWIDKNQNEVVESGEYITGSTPLTYSASVNSGRYKVGVQANDSTASLEDFYCQINVPVQSLGDGHNLLTGVAPDCKLAGLKVLDDYGGGTVADSIDAISWLALNAETYNIIAASMSYSGEVSDTEDTAVNNLVSSGIVCIVTAGNDQGTSYVGGPGTAAKAITVGAVNEEDDLTDYSSIGDPGRTPIKPDVLAPGGSFNMGDKIISVDSNDADETWELDSDCYSDDYRAMAGTSMATPHVSGLAALVADAIGTWQYTSEQALLVKQIILMTSYEIGSAENGDFTPPFNHGGKDNKEGYGRICADAAIEAATMELNISDNTFSFGAEVYDKKVWARQVELTTGKTYTFLMDVPDTGNYDLYPCVIG